jgi:hypothetical protein
MSDMSEWWRLHGSQYEEELEAQLRMYEEGRAYGQSERTRAETRGARVGRGLPGTARRERLGGHTDDDSSD